MLLCVLMENLFKEIGLEGYIFVIVAMICILAFKIKVEYSLLIAFVVAVVIWGIKVWVSRNEGKL